MLQDGECFRWRLGDDSLEMAFHQLIQILTVAVMTYWQVWRRDATHIGTRSGSPLKSGSTCTWRACHGSFDGVAEVLGILELVSV